MLLWILLLFYNDHFMGGALSRLISVYRIIANTAEWNYVKKQLGIGFEFDFITYQVSFILFAKLFSVMVSPLCITLNISA